MPTVDEMGTAELRRLARLHSPAERLRASAEVAADRAGEAKEHWRLLCELSIEASRAARAASQTPEFHEMLKRASAASGAARKAEGAFVRLQKKADDIARQARIAARNEAESEDR